MRCQIDPALLAAASRVGPIFPGMRRGPASPWGVPHDRCISHADAGMSILSAHRTAGGDPSWARMVCAGDTRLSVDSVTADGKRLNASVGEHPDRC